MKEIKTTFFFVSIFLIVVSCSKQQQELPSPNILFIMADDHTSQAISAYGTIFGDLFETPNIDRLASEGMKFHNVYATNAICGPSRAAILTGKYAHTNGYVKNYFGGKFNGSQWTFIKSLHENGYQTSLFGKWHLASEPIGFDFYKYHDNEGQQGTYEDPLYNENGNQKIEKGYATTLTADFFLDWMQNRQTKSKPFATLLHFKAPHRPWVPEEKYKNLFKGIEMPYPETFNDNYKGRQNTAGDAWMTMDYLSRKDMKLRPPKDLSKKELLQWKNYGFDKGQNWMPEGCTTIEDARKWKYQRYIKDYLACVKSVDDNVGRVLDYLDKNGLAENTIVIYTGDQGFFLGENGFFDKRFMYEISSKMPFLVRYPNKIKPKTENNNIITNVDFAPTLVDLAGLEIPKEVQGKSFAPILKGEKSNDWRKSYYYHYYEYPKWHHVHPHYGVRNERYKLIHFYYDVDAWELYDLKNDPQEIHNLINNTAYSDIIAEMKKDIVQHQKELNIDASQEAIIRLTEKNFGGHQ